MKQKMFCAGLRVFNKAWPKPETKVDCRPVSRVTQPVTTASGTSKGESCVLGLDGKSVKSVIHVRTSFSEVVVKAVKVRGRNGWR